VHLIDPYLAFPLFSAGRTSDTIGTMNESHARPLTIGTNLKMHQTPQETEAFVSALPASLAPVLGDRTDIQLFVIPPFTSLAAAVTSRLTGATPIPLWIGAQNMHWAGEGAYTGEISARMLSSLGIDLVLLGHAERRGLFHETDEALSRKVPAALVAGLRVLLAVGETAEERQWGVGAETVRRQLKIALNEVDQASASCLSIAYEPVWSIGSDGTPAEPADVQPIAATMRTMLHDRFGPASNAIPILYGGSVNPENCGAFVALPELDGLFVGRAAWSVEGFTAVVGAALNR
jgi:triosephosphate isomerase